MLRHVPRPLALLLLLPALLAAPRALHPQAPAEPPPSPEEFLGYPLGAHFTSSADVQAYARLLAATSAAAVYEEYGRTPERRDLFHLVIAGAEHRMRLDEIVAAHAELADPRTTEARAREIASRYPAVVYFSYGVHGNEPSASEAAMWTAWDLLRGTTESAAILDSLVVVLDPVVNPDGRDRYVEWYRSVAGATPNPDPRSREHREPWPTGRYNHYLVDLNRDWAWATQPETRARLARWWRWNPLVHVDFHEMDFESSYFFFPAAAPINPVYPEHILRWGERFGKENARAFDARGWAYFTGDEYDLFYPGYGDSWPSLLGAIGMTYEQAGNGEAGLAIRRPSGDTLTLRDRALRHWTSGMTTLRTAAAGKSDLMLDFAAAQRDVGRAQPDVLLVPGPDTLRLAALVRHLRLQGIAVERAADEFRAEAAPHPGFEARSVFPAGTFRVPARQARGRLATTLLAPTVPLRAESSYDISAWSLPYAYGVEAHQTRDPIDAGWSATVAPGLPVSPTPPAPYGYLIPGGSSSAKGVVQLLGNGVRLSVLSRGATIGGRRWSAGRWFVPILDNDSLPRRIDEAGLGALAAPLTSGRAEAGIDLGSEHVWPVKLPRVAVVSGAGVVPSSFGVQWHYLEQQLGLPFDALLLEDLAQLDLAGYDVVVLPDLRSRTLDGSAVERLREWVEAGGRLVAMAGGAAAAAAAFEVPVRKPLGPDSVQPERLLLGRTDRLRGEREEEVTGVILAVRADSAHPVAWGAGGGSPGGPVFILHDGSLVFEPAPDVESVAYFPTRLAATSGIISKENLSRLENGAWLVTRSVGKGSVTLFADDPLFRLFWRETHSLYVNSLLIGPRR
jgi:hypothetical protein